MIIVGMNSRVPPVLGGPGPAVVPGVVRRVGAGVRGRAHVLHAAAAAR